MKLKRLVPLAFVITGCATNYSPLKFQDKFGEFGGDENITASCIEGDFERNDRINKKAEFNNIDIVKCRITNSSDSSIKIADLQDPIAENTDSSLFVSYAQAYRQVSFGQNAYWLYAVPISVGVTVGSGGGNIGYAPPIGIALGLLAGFVNWSIASSANRNFRQELKKYSLEGVITPADSVSRIFFKNAKNSCDTLNIGYLKNGRPGKIKARIQLKEKPKNF